mgnify:CR=1 FL=1
MIKWVQDNSTLIAVYGAFISTVALIWNIYNKLQEKPKIKVTARFGFTDMGGKISENLLIVTAVNKGKQSIYLSSIGLRSGNDDLLNLNTIGLPCELKGGMSHSEWFKAEKLKNRKFDFAWYKDATGKRYKSKNITKKLNNHFNSKKELKNEIQS